MHESKKLWICAYSPGLSGRRVVQRRGINVSLPFYYWLITGYLITRYLLGKPLVMKQLPDK